LLFQDLVIFTLVSAETSFNEQTRYVLPTFPFFFIFASQTALHFNQHERSLTTELTSDFRTLYKAHPAAWGLSSTTKWRGQMALLPATLVASLGAWLVASSLWIYPHSLSYFNESIGSVRNGPQHLLGSNVDWGQDLRYAIASQTDDGSAPNGEGVAAAIHALYEPESVGFDKCNSVDPRVAEDLRDKLCEGQPSVSHTESLADEYWLSINYLYGKRSGFRPRRFTSAKPTVLTQKGNASAASYQKMRIGYSVWMFRRVAAPLR
jgi:hypothetical protein